MTSERKSSYYFIPQSKFLLSENALGNPDLIQSSVTSDCTVTIVDSENFALTDLEEWPSFSLRSTDIRLTAGDGAYNIYIVVPKDDSIRSYASIGFTVDTIDRYGRTADGTQVGDADYRFYLAGTVSAQGGNPSASVTPSGKGRAITMDLGTTPPVVNLPDEVNDYAKVFDITKPDAQNSNSWYMSFLIPIRSMIANAISGVKSLVFGEGDSARELNSVATSTDNNAEDYEGSDTEIATTGWVLSSFGSLDSKYLRKDKEDTAKEIITFLKGLLVGGTKRGLSVDDELVKALVDELKIGDTTRGISIADKLVVALLDKLTVSDIKFGETGKGISISNQTIIALLDQVLGVTSIVSSDFSSGELGSGFVLKTTDTGESYLEIDNLLVRRIAYFIELVIKRISYVGGELILSPASMTCSKVEELASAYRCYFKQDDGSQSIVNEFVVGDLARCQTFNVKEGTSYNISNTFYWREVVAVGDDYIDLSKTKCATSSTVPAAEDNIIQLGNVSDKSRQNAIILSTVGDDAPSIKQYSGINSFELPSSKLVTKLSPSGNMMKGDMYSVSGDSYDATIDALTEGYNTIKEQTDKEFTIWFYTYTPTLKNKPASDWDTTEKKELHEYDIFYDEEQGYAWRFKRDDTGAWAWIQINDQQTLAALEKASTAQKTADAAKESADSKTRTFVTQPTNDDEYDVGDMWANATISVGDTTYTNDLLRCKIAKGAGLPFSINHWQAANGITQSVFEQTNSEIRQGVTDAANAAAAAKQLAQDGVDKAGVVKSALGLTDAQINSGTSVLGVAKGYVQALSQRISFDDDGAITNISTSGLVVQSDFNTLFTQACNNESVISEAGLLTTANAVKLYAKKDGIISAINLSTEGISIDASKIDLVGKVTFSMLDKSTIVDGDYIKTSLIDVDTILGVNAIFSGKLSAATGSFSGKVTASEGKIGYFSLVSGNLYVGDSYTISSSTAAQIRKLQMSKEGIALSNTRGDATAYIGMHEITSDDATTRSLASDLSSEKVEISASYAPIYVGESNSSAKVSVTPMLYAKLNTNKYITNAVAAMFESDNIALIASGGDVKLLPDDSHATYVRGLHLNVVKVTDDEVDDDGYYTIKRNDDVVHVYRSSATTILLDSEYEVGKMLFVKSYSSGSVNVMGQIVPASGRVLLGNVKVNNSSAIFIKLDSTYWAYYNCD